MKSRAQYLPALPVDEIPENPAVLEKIATDDSTTKHVEVYTKADVKPKQLISGFTIWSADFGFTFGIKLMERGEGRAQVNYNLLRGKLKKRRFSPR